MWLRACQRGSFLADFQAEVGAAVTRTGCATLLADRHYFLHGLRTCLVRTQNERVVRTDYLDDRAWQDVVAALMEPW